MSFVYWLSNAKDVVLSLGHGRSVVLTTKKTNYFLYNNNNKFVFHTLDTMQTIDGSMKSGVEKMN